MKLMKSKWFLVCSTVLVVGFLVAQKISIPKFSGISKFEIIDFTNGKMKANSVLKIQNDNWFSFNGKGLQFKMYYKDHLIANGKSDASFRFEKKSENLFSVDADFYADSLFHDLKNILFQDSIQLKVEVDGKFTFLKINSSKTLDTWIDTKDLVDALIINSMGEDGLKVDKVKLKEITIPTTIFDISFRYINKLPFEILLKEIRCGIYSDKLLKTKVSNCDFKIEKLLKKNQSELIEGAANVNNITSALSGLSKVLNGSLDYYINGHALVSIDGREIKIPLRQHFKVNLLTREIVILTDLN